MKNLISVYISDGSGLGLSPPARSVFWAARARLKPDLQSPKARRAFSGPIPAEFQAKIGQFLGNFSRKKLRPKVRQKWEQIFRNKYLDFFCVI